MSKKEISNEEKILFLKEINSYIVNKSSYSENIYLTDLANKLIDINDFVCCKWEDLKDGKYASK